MKVNFAHLTTAILVFLLGLSVVFFIASCSPQHHLQRADKHIQKAVKKGAHVLTKVDTLAITDTITETTTRNDTTFINNTIIRYVTKQGEVRVITRQDKRNEFKLQKQVNTLEGKNERLTTRLNAKNERVIVKHNTKVKRIENRSRWYVWLLVGLIIGFFAKMLLKRLI